MAYTSEVAVAIRRNQKEALTTALSKLSSPPLISKNINTVVIKPSIYNPDYPGNTTVELLKALVSTFKSIGKAVIVESDNPIRTTENAFSKSGYQVLEKFGADLVNLSSVESVLTAMPGFMTHSLRLPVLLFGSRFFVNAATAKIEPGIIALGGGIKNLLGLIPERDKSVYHSRIDDILLDLLSVFRPDLTVIDLSEIVIGVRQEGITRKVGGVIVGLDPVA